VYASDVYMHEEFMLAYFLAKKGEKMVYLYSLNACVCVILHLFHRFACYAYASIVVVVAFILQLFQVCVDVVIDVATSCCS